MEFIPLIHIDALDFIYSQFLKENISREQLIKKVVNYLDIGFNESVGLQLIGNDIQKFNNAIMLLSEIMGYIKTEMNSKIVLIDLNFGCPARREFMNHEGAFLLRFPDKIKRIVDSVYKSMILNNLNLTLSVKIRITKDNNNNDKNDKNDNKDNKGKSNKGDYERDYKYNNKNNTKENTKTSKSFINLIQKLSQTNINMITIHPRTLSQGYLGSSDWSYIKVAREILPSKVIVIGNGDIRNKKDAINIMKTTNCDGIMIGRRALENPFVFREITNNVHSVLTNMRYNDEKVKENKIKIIQYIISEYKQRYNKDSINDNGNNYINNNTNDSVNLLQLLKIHLNWLLKGFNNATQYRARVTRAKSINEIEQILFNF